MEKVEIYISRLLYKHNCVIIPDFGGFVCNYMPAKIIRTQHLIIPPSKSIAFNKNLTNNDGLLVNEIAKCENISFEIAREYVEDFIDNCLLKLKNKETVSLFPPIDLY